MLKSKRFWTIVIQSGLTGFALLNPDKFEVVSSFVRAVFGL